MLPLRTIFQEALKVKPIVCAQEARNNKQMIELLKSSAVCKQHEDKCKNLFREILSLIESHKDKLPPLKNFIGQGCSGCAFLISPEKVLKVTCDIKEAYVAQMLKTENIPNIYKIHDVFKIDENYYGIEQERLYDLDPIEDEGMYTLFKSPGFEHSLGNIVRGDPELVDNYIEAAANNAVSMNIFLSPKEKKRCVIAVRQLAKAIQHVKEFAWPDIQLRNTMKKDNKYYLIDLRAKDIKEDLQEEILSQIRYL